MKKVTITNGRKTKTIKLGFSWLNVFFTPLVTLFRLHLLWFLLCFTFVGWVIYAFNGNNRYVTKLILKKGYLPKTEQDKSILLAHGIGASGVYGA
ncbi:MAG: hypothetical protein IKP61_01170 [Spirochaetales bacterium]|nr:hypothetical protein [Spirochaetales bacterium]